MADRRIGNPDLVGKQVGTAEAARRARRKEAAIVREDLALELFAAGVRIEDMARELSETFGITAHPASVYRLIRRGLAHRAAHEPEAVATARQMLMDRYNALFEAHMPVAIGNGATGAPDVRSGELVLKVLDKMAEILGVRVAPPVQEHNTTFNINVPTEAEKTRDAILLTLTRERDKHRIVEGHLAGADTSLRELTGEVEENDTMGPPPGVIPTQESEAA